MCINAQATISKKMNLLYVVVNPSLYTHYSAGEAYPHAIYPFPNNMLEYIVISMYLAHFLIPMLSSLMSLGIIR